MSKPIALLATVLLFAIATKGTTQHNKDELAKLRAEVAKLREEINLLTIQVRGKSGGPTYRGKPVTFWLEQLKDADYRFRIEAIQALGAMAQRNKTLVQEKKLIPVFLDMLKDQDSGQTTVSQSASWILGQIGPDALPGLIDVAKDKTPENKNARLRAIQAIERMHAKAKAALPTLIEAAKEQDQASRWATIALGNLGSEGKAAIPSLIATLEECFKRETDKKENPLFFGGRPRPRFLFERSEMVLDNLLRIEPKIIEIIPTTPALAFPGGGGPPIGPAGPAGPKLQGKRQVGGDKRVATFTEAEQPWRRAFLALKKKYSAAK
ncbi:MAG: HEAT repeat domain-containing protein [Planctomycetes bacterium]|nr:HEAT repeat domain-containing protein [Planctomycetota bacterium]